MYNQILSRIEDKSAIVSVIGLGYVGLPLAVGMAKSGYSVVGVDVSLERVNTVNQGSSYIPDISTQDVKFT